MLSSEIEDFSVGMHLPHYSVRFVDTPLPLRNGNIVYSVGLFINAAVWEIVKHRLSLRNLNRIKIHCTATL
jgi:hypothetical protein